MSSRRSAEWHLVGHGSDPVPASEWEVRTVVSDMRQRAQDASTAEETLRRLSHLDGWRGEAATTFASKAGDVLDDLGKVVDRYEKVASALADWADDVSVARSRTWSAVQDAEQADREVRAHTRDIAHGPHPTPEQIADQQAADAQRDAAQERLDRARSDMANAMSALDSAADRAKSRIDAAADVWDDGFWGNVKGWIRDRAEVIEILCKALEVIGTILGAVILILVLTIGAPFVLLVGAFVVAALVLAGHLLLKTADEGDVTWTTIGLDVLNVALSVTGLKAFTAVPKALESLRALVPSIATRLGTLSRSAALARLSEGNLTQLENALRIANPRNGLAQWAARIKEGGDLAYDGASRPVLAALDLQPGRLSVLLHQDKEIARLHQLVRAMKGFDLERDELIQVMDAQRKMWLYLGNTTATDVVNAYSAPSIPGKVEDVTRYLEENHPWSLRPTH
ncbi:WXG100 family type VII secretion target [Oryzihumus leptocrescens]|uniref:Putative T7SS secretion signal domain-containing protein n=1 Tax=Oryzihumus leptocrescens TaxID=297536 RepID=A0A542ZHD2_9MICO|nr:hypothetical protein [Oryzihumus leptocrescens]TQL59570.1 hypothetical protein FB474_0926 [Oryzihumus leptocrescens]